MRQTTILIIFLLAACRNEMPTRFDGSLEHTVIVADRSGAVPFDSTLGYAPLSNASVELVSNQYLDSDHKPKRYNGYTGVDGKIRFDNLAADVYTIHVERTLFIDEDPDDSLYISTTATIEVRTATNQSDTLFTKADVPKQLSINEIYYCGPENRHKYVYDQFVELYNSSADTAYLDGVIMARTVPFPHPDIESNDFVQALYVYQFPGTPVTGRQHPLPPGQFLVIAQDALNHRQYMSTSIDLNWAPWEFFNPYKKDVDNAAGNVSNATPENSEDFYLNLKHDGLILANGSRWYYGDYSPQNTGYQYIHIPINTVIDAVEYSANLDTKKLLTARLDAGLTGIGISGYSGRSVERRLPGYDSDNSTADFVILDRPSPGDHH